MAKQSRTRKRNDEIRPTGGMAEISIRALLLAMDLGWDATELRSGQIQLSREHEGSHVTIMIPTVQRSIKKAVGDTWIRKIVRYADPLKLAFMAAAIDQTHSDDPVIKAQGRKNLMTLRSEQVWEDPSVLGTWLQREPDRPTSNGNHPEPEPEPPTAEQPAVEEPADEEPADEPIITKVRPWTARYAMRREGGEVYPSKAVLERKWSDGSTDYACAYEGCEFHAPEARTVSAHYGGKHGKERPATQTDTYVDPSVSWVPSERQKGRIARLTKELEAAAQALGGAMTAESCAEWIVKRRDEAREGLTDETTPLTPEQIIERVRKLVDGGAYADLLARIDAVEAEATARVAETREQLSSKERGMTNAIRAMENRLAEKEQELEEATKLATEAKAAEVEAQARWRALKDLINEP